MKQGMSLQSIDNIACISLGCIVGLVKYCINIHLPVDFGSKLLEGAITAGVCGFFSWAGKELWVIGKKAFIAYFKTRKSNKHVGKDK
jgi:hypothetical protein